MRTLIGLAAIALLTAASCSGKRDADSVLAFFAKGKIGYSVDYGLYQQSELRTGEWDHVATVHGMSDDLDFCTKVRKSMETAFPGSSFDCRPLN